MKNKKQVNILDVAREAGVSIATVSRVLNRHANVSKKTREKVLKVINSIQYQPHLAARVLAENKSKNRVLWRTKLIRVFSRSYPEAELKFFHIILDGINATLSDQGYHTIISGFEKFTEPVSADLLECDGVILVGERHEEVMNYYRAAHKPMVVVDDDPGDANIDWVIPNNEDGILQAMDYLISLGHRKIAYLGSTKGMPGWEERFTGYKKALEKSGLPFSKELVLDCMADIEEAKLHLLNRLKSPSHLLTAVVCCNDIVAVGALKACKEAGVKVPEQMSIIGFDDIHVCLVTDPNLTTVKVPRYAMGEEAAKKIMARINGEKSLGVKIVLPTRLIIRESCQAIKR